MNLLGTDAGQMGKILSYFSFKKWEYFSHFQTFHHIQRDHMRVKSEGKKVKENQINIYVLLLLRGQIGMGTRLIVSVLLEIKICKVFLYWMEEKVANLNDFLKSALFWRTNCE